MNTTLEAILTAALFGAIVTAVVLQVLLHTRNRQARNAERRAARAERLAELGSMTSGLAHEIKNPLSTVVLNAQLIREALDEADLPAEDAGRMKRRTVALEREAIRLREILDDFLRFAGRIRLDPEERDVREIVDDLVDFFHPQCEQAGILLRSDLGASRVLASVDEGLLKQALLNLLINAVQAMANTPAAESELLVRLEHDESEVRIHIIDRGGGIAPGMEEDIFHPYVSSKPGGTGLGLPTTRRIIQEHGGHVELFSHPGQGSDFIVHLPKPQTN